jgi:hypothetical protein
VRGPSPVALHMRQSAAWQRYFERNRDRDSPGVGSMDALSPPVRAALIRSLGRFYLGASSEGRLAKEAEASDDPALDDAMRASIALYVREEGRHARELAGALRALGAPLPRRHWSESLFRRGRRLLGLRTKMMVIVAAEIVGVVFYRLLADHVPPVARMARAIARDEERHLEFQIDYFSRVLGRNLATRLAGGALATTGLFALVCCAVSVFVVDHAPLLAALGVRRSEIVRRCAAITSRSFAARGGRSSPLRVEQLTSATMGSTFDR